MGLLSKFVRPVFAAFAAFALVSSGSAAGQCTGNPPMLNGLPCATTTRYWDGQLGACGCGSNNAPFSWQWESYTAAGSQVLFDPSGSSWCGEGCGACYELTPTGDCPTGGDCAPTHDPITVMVTNLCPNNGNAEWCPNPGSTNAHGYGAHFDLMDHNMAGLITALGWDNPVVTYQRVPCGNLGSPTCADAATCECSTGACASAANTTAPKTTAHATSAPTTYVTAKPAAHATAAPTSRATAQPAAHATLAPTSHATAAPTSHATAKPAAHATPAPTSHAHRGERGAPPRAPAIGSSAACRAGISFKLTGLWDDGGEISVTLSNTGSESITGVQVSGQYSLPASGFPLAPGAAFTSAFNFSGTQPAAGFVALVSC